MAKRTNLRSIIKSIAWVGSSQYVTAGLAVLRGVLFARILDPTGYGIWGFLSMIQTLSVNADLGVRLVVERDMPRLSAESRQDDAKTLAAAGRLWTPTSGLIIGVILAALWPVFGWPTATGWTVLIPLLLAGMAAYVVACSVEVGSLAFRRLAIITTTAGTIGLVSGVIFAKLFGVTGLTVSQAAVYGSVAVVAAFLRPERAAWAGIFARLKLAIVGGWRLLLPNLSLQALTSVDMLVAARATTTSQVGLYSIALLGSSMVGSVIAGGVGTVVGQHLLRDTASSGSKIPRAVFVWGPPAALAAVLAPACALAALLTPTVLRLVLPAYLPATGPAVLLLAAAFYLNSQFGFSSSFVAAGKQLMTVPVYWILVAVNVAIDIALLRLGWGLIAIATGTLIVNALFMIVHQTMIGVLIVGGRWEVLQGIFAFFTGLLPLGAALYILGFGAVALAVAAVGALGWAGTVWMARRWLVNGVSPSTPGGAQ